MECLSCLNDPAALLVADASVAINLNATGFAEPILEALPNRFAVVEDVAFELEDGRQRGRTDADALEALVAAGRVDVVRLKNSAIEQFTALVMGSAAETLDDGEAATIAYALEHGATALVDERKANRICAERFPSLLTASTVDVFAHDTVESALGRKGLADAVFNALYYGRMRVLARHVDWVVNLIGPERAARCASLPGSARPAASSRVG